MPANNPINPLARCARIPVHRNVRQVGGYENVPRLCLLCSGELPPPWALPGRAGLCPRPRKKGPPAHGGPHCCAPKIAAPPNGRPPLNQEPFGPQEGEREGPDGPLCRNALVSLGSFVAIFRTRLRPPFLFVCLTPFPFALLFLFSFIRLIGPLYYCGLSWPFWSYHVVRRFLYVLYHRCC